MGASSSFPGRATAPPRREVPTALAWSAVAALFMLMTLGNVVSATGSGLACPDWPLCHGRLVPPLEPSALVEYAHRLTAALTSVLLVVTIVRTARARVPGTRGLGILLLALLAGQIGLGAITVLLKLPHLVSTAHLVNALLILAGLLALGGAAARQDRASVPDRVKRLVQAALLVLLAQLALGGYVRHAGAGLACPDFPLCGGDLLPGAGLAVGHWIHRWLGVALLGLFVHLAVTARRTAVGGVAWVALVIALLQVSLGIATVLLRLAPPVRATHAAIGYALWGVLVWMALRCGAWRASGVAEPVPARGLGEVARVA